MTHPDTLQIPRAVVEQALAGLAFYLNEAGIKERNDPHYTPEDWAAFDAEAALRAALQPQAAVTTSGPPERDNSKPAEQQGVFRKFNVQRTDGSDQPGGKHHGCEYFVLDVAHDQHAKPALEAYAVACATTHPQLSADMRERYGLQAQAASDCRTCQHLSEAWGVCEARPKCVGGEQYVYFPEKQLWDKTPRNDGQAAHQEMREALYAEFNRAVGRQHD